MSNHGTALDSRFRRLFAATAASDLADGVARTALPLAAAAYTRDPLLISGLATFAFLPWLLFALPAGALVDRTDRRIAMAVANSARTLATFALALLVVSGAGGITALYVVAFVLGVDETVYDSAVRALLPQLVRRDQLDRANSLLTVGETLGQTFLGAPLGSALFALAVALPFWFNSAGFLIAVVLIASLRGGFRPVRENRVSVRADVVEGVRWLRDHALLRGLTLVSGATSFAQSMTTGVFVLYVLEVVHLPASDYGFVLLAAGAGALLGGILTPVAARRFGRTAVLTGGSLLSGLSLGAMAFTSHGVLAATFFAMESVGVMTWNVLTMSLRQALIPEGLFGRVQGAYRTVVWGSIPIGSLAGGALAHLIGVRWVFAVAGGVLVVLAALLGRLLVAHGTTVAAATLSDGSELAAAAR